MPTFFYDDPQSTHLHCATTLALWIFFWVVFSRAEHTISMSKKSDTFVVGLAFEVVGRGMKVDAHTHTRTRAHTHTHTHTRTHALLDVAVPQIGVGVFLCMIVHDGAGR